MQRSAIRPGYPCVPARRPVFCGEFPIGLEIEIALQRSRREDVSELGTDSDDTCFIVAEKNRRAAVGGNLLIKIADRAELDLFGDELRSAPVDMPIDAVGIARAWIGEVAGEAGDDRKFVTGLRV